MTALWMNGAQNASVGSASIAAATGEFTITDHGLVDGERVTVDSVGGGAVGVLAERGVYFVRDATDDEFRLTTHQGGLPVEFQSDGSADVYRWVPAYPARTLRQAMGGLVQHGRVAGLDPDHAHRLGAKQGMLPVLGNESVSASGGSWSVLPNVYVIYPADSSNQGPYLVPFEGDSGPFDPADSTFDRIDVVDLQVQDNDEDGSGFRRVRPVYQAGEPSGSPEPPALTPGAVRAGRFLVHAGGSPGPEVIGHAPLTVARGGILPIRHEGELPTGNRYPGMAVYVIDTRQMLVNTDGAGGWAPLGPTSGEDANSSPVEIADEDGYVDLGVEVEVDIGPSGLAIVTQHVAWVAITDADTRALDSQVVWSGANSGTTVGAERLRERSVSARLATGSIVNNTVILRGLESGLTTFRMEARISTDSLQVNQRSLKVVTF